MSSSRTFTWAGAETLLLLARDAELSGEQEEMAHYLNTFLTLCPTDIRAPSVRAKLSGGE